MKIIKPSVTAQSIVLDTRFYPQGSIVLELINEATEEVLIIDNTYITVNGVTTVSFDLDSLEGDRFQIKITEGNNVVYRGKVFCTDQDTQNYKLTDNRYIY